MADSLRRNQLPLSDVRSTSASRCSILAEVYGPYENEVLLGKALKGLRDKVVIATKFGFKIAPEGKSGSERMIGLNGTPENAKKVADESLKRLRIEAIISSISTASIRPCQSRSR